MANSSKRKTNITEVARAAGVSKMTVSRMMNQAGKVAPATRLKIQEVIDKLQYRPSSIARGLATNKTRIIGLMMFSNDDSFYLYRILQGVEQKAKVQGYDLLLFARPEKNKALDTRGLGLVEGVLCFGTPYDNHTLEKLARDNIPFVVLGRRKWRRIKPWQVCPDYITGFRNAVLYLTGLGHRKIAMIGGVAGFEPDMEKHEGFRQGLAEAGIPHSPEMDLYDHEVYRIKEILQTCRPTAVIVENVNTQLGLFLAAKELALRIPGDMSIISTGREFEMYSLCSLAGIHEFTSIGVPWQELGKLGLELVIRLINGEKDVPREHSIPLLFSTGESCVPPPALKSSRLK
jgi:LacI family transcriptional regulator/LacI family repressor for deo operon, udp, cdd, tsx, nupC, and nupG